MEWWNDGILVFKKMFTILKLSSIQPVVGPLIQHCIILSELQALPSGVSSIIPLRDGVEQEARNHYSTIPAFQHSSY